MPRFFFHRADGSLDRDREGTELASVSDARKEAVVYAGETLKYYPELARSGKEFRIEVEDEDGRVVFVLRVVAEDSLTPDSQLSPIEPESDKTGALITIARPTRIAPALQSVLT